MSLLLDAALAWRSLKETVYKILIGKKGKSHELTITFLDSEFYHASGIQHVDDVDFGLNKNEFWGHKLITAVIDGHIDGDRMVKSQHWPTEKTRLETMCKIENILDNDFSIFEFHGGRLPFHSEICAEYVIRSHVDGSLVFVFIDKDHPGYYFCRSLFKNDDKDYSRNQPQWTILKKRKRVAGAETTLFQHPKYKEEER